MITELKPLEHFKELVSDAIRNQGVDADELTEFYLSGLLESFVAARKLSSEPLAFTYLKALGSDTTEKSYLLKELGDVSLFTSGFFSDSLKRKIVDIDYYIDMGSGSYGWLAGLYGERKKTGELGALFSELSKKFKPFVDVLAEVSERSNITSSKDILRLYERWLYTKSRRTEAILRELGIEPCHVTTKPIH
ncbi:MAG TPA: hypothetical protein VJM57_09070 [Thermodesulfobacteriota bacterium]|nr:hypothetical protein [Thermodesulfobacteriota bacterium]